MLFMCEGWVGDGTDCYILTPSSSDYSSTSSSFCWAAQPGSWGPKPSVWSWFSLPRTATRNPTNCLQLTQAVCGTWLYNCLPFTSFLRAYQSPPNSTTSTGQGHTPISSNGCTSYLIDCSVEGQYVTNWLNQRWIQVLSLARLRIVYWQHTSYFWIDFCLYHFWLLRQ